MYQCDSCTASYTIESQAREIAELRADLDKARTAIRVQAAAVRTLDTTGRVLAAHDRAAAERARSESRPEALESERAMNAKLTDDSDTAQRELAEARELHAGGGRSEDLSNQLRE